MLGRYFDSFSEANFDRLWAQSDDHEVARGEVHNFDYFDCSLTFSPARSLRRDYLGWEIRSKIDRHHPTWYELQAMQNSILRAPIPSDMAQRYLWNLISCHPYQMHDNCKLLHKRRHGAVGWFSLSNWYFAMCGIPIKSLAQFLRLRSDCITLVGMLFSRFCTLEMILKWNLVINFEAQTSSAIQQLLCGEDVFTLLAIAGERFACKSKWKWFFFVYTSQRDIDITAASLYDFYFAIRNLMENPDCKTSREKLC
jgi:hypothetical protein